MRIAEPGPFLGPLTLGKVFGDTLLSHPLVMATIFRRRLIGYEVEVGKCCQLMTTNSISQQLAVQQPPEKRIKLVPPTNERIMIYVRQESEDAYTALHLVSVKKMIQLGCC